ELAEGPHIVDCPLEVLPMPPTEPDRQFRSSPRFRRIPIDADQQRAACSATFLSQRALPDTNRAETGDSTDRPDRRPHRESCTQPTLRHPQQTSFQDARAVPYLISTLLD